MSGLGISKVYVANRGEIAARVGRTCARLGVEVLAADVASFLDADALIAQARAWGADAVHPGYGFLSENADFAQAVTDAGLTWIGPSPSAISAMARKDKAREIAEAASVPVAARYDVDSVPDDAYPVLVKAAAGGGGKGMHVVRQPDELANAVATAAREAKAAFGDDTLLIERYIEGGRHVEVQVFGDTKGRVVHLGTRDCSAQRRHQKIIEEAPAPALSDGLRTRLHDAAVALARAVEYANAGTVEFLVIGDEAFLLEMNTRLQVEHPVTEEITGLDLVEWQLRVASGESLPLKQRDIAFSGHAVEARVYAEDPYHGFLPQAGRALAVEWPGGDVRIEEDFDGTVTTQFDPMIAKLVVHRANRAEALAAMLGALKKTAFYGLTTNVGYLHRVVEAMALPDALIHTNWLEGEGAHLLEPPAEPVVPVTDSTPFGVADGWRLGGEPVDVVHVPTRRIGGRLFARDAGHTWEVVEPDPFDRTHGSGPAGDEVVAPMPGTVVAIDVAEGDSVVAGQRLGSLEAMKMELALAAPHDGTVTHVGAVKGDQATQGHILVTVTPAVTPTVDAEPVKTRRSRPVIRTWLVNRSWLVVSSVALLLVATSGALGIASSPDEPGSRRAAKVLALPIPDSCKNGATKPFTPTSIDIQGVRDELPILALARDGNDVPGVPPITADETVAWDRPPRGLPPGSPRGNVLLNAHTGFQTVSLGNAMLAKVDVGNVIRLRNRATHLCYRVTKRVEVSVYEEYEPFYAEDGPPQFAFIVCSGERTGPQEWTKRTLWFGSPIGAGR